MTRIVFYGTQPAKEGCTSYFIHFIACEYLPNSLESEIKQRKNRQQTFNEGEIWYIIESLNSVVGLFQSRGYSHGDLQPKNIMVDANGCIKLIDNKLFSPLNGKSMMVRYSSSSQTNESPKNNYPYSVPKWETLTLGFFLKWSDQPICFR